MRWTSGIRQSALHRDTSCCSRVKNLSNILDTVPSLTKQTGRDLKENTALKLYVPTLQQVTAINDDQVANVAIKGKLANDEGSLNSIIFTYT